jgi:hypothetical protein
MSARTTRGEARERIIKSFMDSLDRIVPREESVPLRGKTFLDWEHQADAMRQAVLPTLLQERAALDEAAVPLHAAGTGRIGGKIGLHAANTTTHVPEGCGGGAIQLRKNPAS